MLQYQLSLSLDTDLFAESALKLRRRGRHVGCGSRRTLRWQTVLQSTVVRPTVISVIVAGCRSAGEVVNEGQRWRIDVASLGGRSRNPTVDIVIVARVVGRKQTLGGSTCHTSITQIGTF